MLRIHFTFEDLCRVRIARSPDVLWEITNGFQTLQRSDADGKFGGWRCWARRDERVLVASGLLRPLLPARGYSPDFLTPRHGDHSTLDAALDTVRGTPRARLRGDLVRTCAERRLPAWSRALAGGDADTLGELCAALRTFYEGALEPMWSHVQAAIDNDRRARIRVLRDEGLEGLFATLAPCARWKPPVLEVDYPVGGELQLGGRGLTLQPSYFCWPGPVSLADTSLEPVLVHPVRLDAAEAPGEWGRHDPLAAMFGNSTRAGILRCACGTGCLSTELTRRLGVTSSAVTQQTAILRDAGLISSSRWGRTVYHVATALGQELVRTASRRPRGR